MMTDTPLIEDHQTKRAKEDPATMAITMNIGIKGTDTATETRIETRGPTMTEEDLIMETETGGPTTTFVTGTDLRIAPETGGPRQPEEEILTATTLISGP